MSITVKFYPFGVQWCKEGYCSSSFSIIYKNLQTVFVQNESHFIYSQTRNNRHFPAVYDIIQISGVVPLDTQNMLPRHQNNIRVTGFVSSDPDHQPFQHYIILYCNRHVHHAATDSCQHGFFTARLYIFAYYLFFPPTQELADRSLDQSAVTN